MSHSTRQAAPVPWHELIQFHRDVVHRAEDSFFSFENLSNGVSQEGTRWSDLSDFDLTDFVGPWEVPLSAIVDKSFRTTLQQERPNEYFLAGPCYHGRKESIRPLMYLSIKASIDADMLTIDRREAFWNVSPVMVAELNRAELYGGELGDDLLDNLVQLAGDFVAREGMPASSAVWQAMPRIIPDSQNVLRACKSSRWIIFRGGSQNLFYNQHLARDYEQLGKYIETDANEIGGLRLLERPCELGQRNDHVDLLEIIALNKSQAQVVQSALNSNRVTVVSGPPGCGKSQIVLSLILNAWARGKSLLFASTNNKAVDVVRDRLRQFESEFPVAVRCGSHGRNNILDAIDNVVFKASPSQSVAKPSATEIRQLVTLREERNRLIELLDNEIPQRIDDHTRKAMELIRDARDIHDQLTDKDVQLSERRCRLNVHHMELDQLTAAMRRISGIPLSLSQCKASILSNEQARIDVEERLSRSRKDLRELVSPARSGGEPHELNGELAIESLRRIRSSYRDFKSWTEVQKLSELRWETIALETPEIQNCSGRERLAALTRRRKKIVSEHQYVSVELDRCIRELNKRQTALRNSFI